MSIITYGYNLNAAVGDQKPTMNQLNSWSKDSPLRIHWYNFAVELVGKENSEIIRATYVGGGTETCLQRILIVWYYSIKDHSWQMIVDALKQMEEWRVIESITDECQSV